MGDPEEIKLPRTIPKIFLDRPNAHFEGDQPNFLGLWPKDLLTPPAHVYVTFPN